MSYLAERGLVVPRAMFSIKNKVFEKIEGITSSETVLACLLSWLEGQQLSSLLPGMKKEDAQQIHTNPLVRCHCKSSQTAAVEWDVPKEFSRPSFDVDGLLGEEPLWGKFWEVRSIDSSDRMELSLIKDKLRIALEGLGTEDSNLFGIVHADLHSENILVHNERSGNY